MLYVTSSGSFPDPTTITTKKYMADRSSIMLKRSREDLERVEDDELQYNQRNVYHSLTIWTKCVPLPSRQYIVDVVCRICICCHGIILNTLSRISFKKLIKRNFVDIKVLYYLKSCAKRGNDEPVRNCYYLKSCAKAVTTNKLKNCCYYLKSCAKSGND